MLHRRTDGNPLFLVNTIDDLIARGQLREVDGQWVLAVPVKDLALDAPETLWQMVEKQIERLTPDEQAMLAVGERGGRGVLGRGRDGGRDRRAGRRSGAVRPWRGEGSSCARPGVAEWPDGTVAGRYAFIHALYQHVLYARVPIGHRVGLHLRTGERLERAYGQRAGEIAGELAMHFEQGRDFERAARYRQQAGEDRAAPARVPRGRRPPDAGARLAGGAARLAGAQRSRS